MSTKFHEKTHKVLVPGGSKHRYLSVNGIMLRELFNFNSIACKLRLRLYNGTIADETGREIVELWSASGFSDFYIGPACAKVLLKCLIPSIFHYCGGLLVPHRRCNFECCTVSPRLMGRPGACTRSKKRVVSKIL